MHTDETETGYARQRAQPLRQPLHDVVIYVGVSVSVILKLGRGWLWRLSRRRGLRCNSAL